MRNNYCRSPIGLNISLHAQRRGFLLLVLLFSFCIGSKTQLAAQTEFPLVISCGIHALTFPWHLGPVSEHLSPAFMAGTERTLKSVGRIRLYQTANLGFFQHHWWISGLFLNTELGASCRLPLGFHVDLRLGVGYMHCFYRRKILELKDGKYVRATDWGVPSLMVPLALELGYRGNSIHPRIIAPFVSVQWAFQGLFQEEASGLPHLFLFVGGRIPLGRIHSKGGR
jgi:hypothetical protein